MAGKALDSFFFLAVREVLYKCVFHECNSSASDSLERTLVAVYEGNNTRVTKIFFV